MSHSATFKPKEDPVKTKEHNDAMRAKYEHVRYHCDLCHIDVGYYSKSTHLRSLQHLKALDKHEDPKVAKSGEKTSAAYDLFQSKLKGLLN